MNIIKRFVENMENTFIPLPYFYFSFISILVLRAFGEAYSQRHNYFNQPSLLYFWGFLQTTSFFIVMAVGLIGILNMATGDKLEKTIRFVLLGFSIVMMTPILDLIFSHSHGADIMYIHPEANINIWYTYLTLYGGYSGISLGLRIESFCIIFGLYLYLLVKKTGWIASAFFTWLSYCFGFLMAASPLYLKAFLTHINVAYRFTDELMIVYFSLISLLISIVIFLSHKKPTIVLGRSALYKLMSQLLLITAGAIFALYHYPTLYTYSLWRLSVSVHAFFVLASFFLVSLSRIGLLNTEKNRSIDVRDMVVIGLSIVLMAVLNSGMLFLFVMYMLLGYIYMMPPYSCKKIKGLSQIILSGKAVILISIGYMLMLAPPLMR